MTIKEFNAQPLRPAKLLATVRYYTDKNKRGRVFERVPIVPCYYSNTKKKLRVRTFYVLRLVDPATAYAMYNYPHTKRIILNVDFLEDEQ